MVPVSQQLFFLFHLWIHSSIPPSDCFVTGTVGSVFVLSDTPEWRAQAVPRSRLPAGTVKSVFAAGM